MVTTSILGANFVTLSFIVGLAILTITNRSFNKRYNKIFVLFISIVLLLDIADMVEYYCSLRSDLIWLRFIASAFGYTLRPASLAIIFKILFRRKKLNILGWVPVAVIAVIAFTSSSTHVMFWFNCNNYFMRGPLNYLPHIVSGVYLVILVVVTVMSHRNLDIGETLVIIYIVALCMIVTYLETMYNYKFLLPGVMITSCALYYIVIYVQSYKVDTLTGALNRRCLFNDCEKWQSQSFAVVSIDLNGLKRINDGSGHKQGDIAICALVDVLTESSGREFRIYRNGGDEFIALGRQQKEENAKKFIERTRCALGKTKYMASFGYSMHEPYDSLDDVLVKADVSMYKDKRSYKNKEAQDIVCFGKDNR